MPTQADMLRSGTVLQFDREQAPERIVHARGMTAFGTFEVTHDISHLTSAAFLNGVGTQVREAPSMLPRQCLCASALASGSGVSLGVLSQQLTASAYWPDLLEHVGHVGRAHCGCVWLLRRRRRQCASRWSRMGATALRASGTCAASPPSSTPLRATGTWLAITSRSAPANSLVIIFSGHCTSLHAKLPVLHGNMCSCALEAQAVNIRTVLSTLGIVVFGAGHCMTHWQARSHAGVGGMLGGCRW